MPDIILDDVSILVDGAPPPEANSEASPVVSPETSAPETPERSALPEGVRITTIRSGLLVYITTALTGGVEYRREQLADPTRQEDGALEEEWSTRKRVENPEEIDEAGKLRSAARNSLQGVCLRVGRWLICPPEKERELWARFEMHSERVREFNARATTCRVTLSVLPTRVEANNQRATQAMVSEAQTLLSDIVLAIEAADVEGIRKAAAAASRVASMLDGPVGEELETAVKAARSVARAATKRIEKLGEDVASFNLPAEMPKQYQAVSKCYALLFDEEDRINAVLAATRNAVPEGVELLGFGDSSSSSNVDSSADSSSDD